MKGLIIGTDLLEYNDNVKVVELNTNAGIPNSVTSYLDVTPLFEKLIELNIKEFHFIYTEGYCNDRHINDRTGEFTIMLENKCILHNIQFFTYEVKRNSLIIPNVSDADDIFILRQSYDDTALVDSLYTADKYGFLELIKDETYSIPSTTTSIDTLSSIDTSHIHPNIIVKSRHPRYDSTIYPELYALDDISQLNELKSQLQDPYLIQQYIFSESNVIENRHSVIRSVDIIYGGELTPINIGCYRTTAIVDSDFYETEFIVNTNKLSTKGRLKYINKKLIRNLIHYHADSDSLILKSDASVTTVNELQLHDELQSINFIDKNGLTPSDPNFNTIIYRKSWDSTLENDNLTLSTLTSSVKQIDSKIYDTLFIKITLANGEFWLDLPDTTYYIENLNGTTSWKLVNTINVGDKLIVIDHKTTEMESIEIISLTVEFSSMQIYQIDVEPSDLFLVDIGSNKMAIMHNFFVEGGIDDYKIQ